MPNYRRSQTPGASYFFTQVTEQRVPWLCQEIPRVALRQAIQNVMKHYPFTLDAIVLLPDHFHCILTLPPGDSDYSTRLRLIKTYVTKSSRNILNLQSQISLSREKKKESNLWQRRYWEHEIRDEQDYVNHCDYIHYNPVKHGLCNESNEWKFSSFSQFVQRGIYPVNWGVSESSPIPDHIGGE